MKIGVVGAGVMGTGIAELAARHGHQVWLVDTEVGALDRYYKLLDISHKKQISKGVITADESNLIRNRIVFINRMDVLGQADWVFEAIIEDAKSKKMLFKMLSEIVGSEIPLSTNTSSLSVTGIASACLHPERVLGVHFFNPVHQMALVEIIPGLATSPIWIEKAQNLMQEWGKTSILSKDCPGFIVNRIARPFYLESLRIAEEGESTFYEIDQSIKQLGFKMGPFELMDFVGNDINYAVSEVIFRETGYDSRYRTTILQKRMIEAGWLGKKSGKGYYAYSSDGKIIHPQIDFKIRNGISQRVLVMLINEAAHLYQNHIASRNDIDLAVTLGLNYPKGLLSWADEIGIRVVIDQLESIYHQYMEERYRPAVILREMVKNNHVFYPEKLTSTSRSV